MSYISMNERQLKQYEIYQALKNQHKSFVISELKTILSTELYTVYSKYVKPTRNPVKRIAEVLSVTYKKPPRRYTRNRLKDIDTILQDKLHEVNLILREVEKQVNSVGDVFVIPYYDNNTDKVNFEIVPAYLVEVEYDRSTPVAYKILDPETKHKRIFKTNGEFLREDAEGKVYEQTTTVFKYAPVIHFKLNPTNSIEQWNVYENEDIYNTTIQIGVLETYHNRVSYLRSFRQPKASSDEVASSSGRNQADITLAPDSLVPYDLQTVELADPADEYLNSIRALEIDIAGSRGISSNMYFRQGKDNGAVGTNSDITAELRQHWNKSTQIMSNSEKMLMLSAVDQYLFNTSNKISGLSEEDFIIDYIEPIPELEDPSTALKVLSDSIKLGIDNVIDFMLRNNPDLHDAEEAMAKLEENIAIRAKMVQKMRELNTPADILEQGVGLSPQDNGGLNPNDNNLKTNVVLND